MFFNSTDVQWTVINLSSPSPLFSASTEGGRFTLSDSRSDWDEQEWRYEVAPARRTKKPHPRRLSWTWNFSPTLPPQPERQTGDQPCKLVTGIWKCLSEKELLGGFSSLILPSNRLFSNTVGCCGYRINSASLIVPYFNQSPHTCAGTWQNFFLKKVVLIWKWAAWKNNYNEFPPILIMLF